MEYRIQNLMLIDDDVVDQKLYKRIIDRTGRVENIIQFEAADLALEYLRSAECPQIDAIILDLRMPRMDGFEFLDAINSEDELEKVHAVIVMLTTSLAPEDQARAKNHPLVKDFWNKPLEERMIIELCALLKSIGGHEA